MVFLPPLLLVSLLSLLYSIFFFSLLPKFITLKNHGNRMKLYYILHRGLVPPFQLNTRRRWKGARQTITLEEPQSTRAGQMLSSSHSVKSPVLIYLRITSPLTTWSKVWKEFDLNFFWPTSLKQHQHVNIRCAIVTSVKGLQKHSLGRMWWRLWCALRTALLLYPVFSSKKKTMLIYCLY